MSRAGNTGEYRGMRTIAIGLRLVSYLIVAIAVVAGLIGLVISVSGGHLSPFSAAIAGEGGAIISALALYIVSEVIDVLVDIAQQVRGISKPPDR